MKKLITFLTGLALLVSCKQELVKKPERLIEKEIMLNVMVDLSILDAIKYQNPASLDTFKINPRDYIFKKYKIDSLQFVKSNGYYAADYEDYKAMFEEILKRLDDKQKNADSLVNIEKKQKKLVVSKKKKRATRSKDTLDLK